MIFNRIHAASGIYRREEARISTSFTPAQRIQQQLDLAARLSCLGCSSRLYRNDKKLLPEKSTPHIIVYANDAVILSTESTNRF